MSAAAATRHDGRSYYGRPIIKRAGLEARDRRWYFFAGGLAGASSLLALAARGARQRARWRATLADRRSPASPSARRS